MSGNECEAELAMVDDLWWESLLCSEQQVLEGCWAETITSVDDLYVPRSNLLDLDRVSWARLAQQRGRSFSFFLMLARRAIACSSWCWVRKASIGLTLVLLDLVLILSRRVNDDLLPVDAEGLLGSVAPSAV